MTDEQYTYSKKEKESKSNMLLIGVLIVLIVIVAGTVVIFMMNQKPDDGNGIDITPPNKTNQTNETECDEECLAVKAITNNDVEYCKQIEDEEISQYCYKHLSNTSLDACIHVKNISIYNECVVMHAEKEKDPDICEYLADNIVECKAGVDECYLSLGYEKRICLADKHKNVSYCEEDQDCIYQYSMTNEDAQACDLIVDDAKKYACSSILRDQDECYFIESTAKKDLCRFLWGQGTGDKLICTMITTGTVYARDCFTHFAIETNDPNFCSYGETLELDDRWDCYINYSLGTGDTNGCEKIDKRAPTSKFTCYYELAKKFGNPHACDLIGDPGQTNTCYVGAIIGNENLDYLYCKDIRSITWKNKCYTEYAKIKKDTSFCDPIETMNERDACYDAVEVASK